MMETHCRLEHLQPKEFECCKCGFFAFINFACPDTSAKTKQFASNDQMEKLRNDTNDLTNEACSGSMSNVRAKNNQHDTEQGPKEDCKNLFTCDLGSFSLKYHSSYGRALWESSYKLKQKPSFGQHDAMGALSWISFVWSIFLRRSNVNGISTIFICSSSSACKAALQKIEFLLQRKFQSNVSKKMARAFWGKKCRLIVCSSKPPNLSNYCTYVQ